MSQTPDPVAPTPGTTGTPTGPSTGTSAPKGSTKPGGGAPAKGSGGAKAADPLRSSRTSGFYAAIIGLGVVLVLLVIFIIQNTDTASVNFLGWQGNAPQAVLLLIALAAGIFLTATASSLRLLQVRRRVKQERKR